MIARSFDIVGVVAVTCAVLVALVMHGGGTARAAGSDAPPFDAVPAVGSDTDERASYFMVQARPGIPVRQQVAITNRSSTPLTLLLDAVETTTGPLGGITYAVARQGGAASRVDWVRLEANRVTVAAGATELVPFSVQLPRGADSGEHVAGIAIERVAAGDPRAAPSSAGAAAGVVVRTRRIIAVQATVPGPLNRELRIAGVTAAPRADGMYLMVELENVGNTLVKGRGRIDVDSDPAVDETFDLDTFVPKTTIEYPIRWTDRPSAGEFSTSVDVTYGGATARWSGVVRVGERELRGFDDRSGAKSASNVPTWMLVAGAAMGLVALVGAGVWHRRRGLPATDEHVELY